MFARFPSDWHRATDKHMDMMLILKIIIEFYCFHTQNAVDNNGEKSKNKTLLLFRMKPQEKKKTL